MADKLVGKLRIAFMGTPDFSTPVLETLIAAGHDVVCVYSQPPRAAGRGQKEKLTPVHAKAEALGIEVRTPKSLKSTEEQADFAALKLDCAVVVAYGLILPKAILDAPRLGCLNIHASLLPRWRGAAPIQRAIVAGDAMSGVTIMQMDEGLDTGAMLLVDQVGITHETTGESLHDALSEMGAKLIVEALEARAANTVKAIAQPESGITYASKLERAEGHIDWQKSAAELERLVRAFTPWPGSWFEVGKERIKILSAELGEGGGVPGTVLDDQLTVACASGALRLTQVQRAGRGPMAAADFLRGYELPPGSRLS
jgi:methionyl-tRNA formyltransferase